MQIAERSRDSFMVNPEVMLRDVLADLESGKLRTKKLLLIVIDDTDGNYVVGFRSSQLKCSEILAAADILKSMMRRLMGYG
mgnify:CR=1 FL=1